MATVATHARPRNAGPANGPGRKRGYAARSRLVPYLMLIPALVLELLVHLIPMMVGVWMSLKGLTQFYIRSWSAAPFKGLGNYRVVVDTHGPVGANLLNSLGVTIAYSVISVALCWLFGTSAAVLLQRCSRVAGWYARSS